MLKSKYKVGRGKVVKGGNRETNSNYNIFDTFMHSIL